MFALSLCNSKRKKNVRKELENEVCIYVCCLLPQKMCLCERIFNIKYIYYSSEKKPLGYMPAIHLKETLYQQSQVQQKADFSMQLAAE